MGNLLSNLFKYFSSRNSDFAPIKTVLKEICWLERVWLDLSLEVSREFDFQILIEKKKCFYFPKVELSRSKMRIMRRSLSSKYMAHSKELVKLHRVGLVFVFPILSLIKQNDK